MKVKNFLGITGLTTLVLLFFVAAFTSCSSDEEFAEGGDQAPQQKMIPFTTTIGAKSTEGSTRAVNEEGVTTWVVGEEIAMVVGDKLYKATVTEVASNGSATVTGAVEEGTADGSAVNLIYPYSAVDESTKAIKADLLKAQLGTIADLSANYDVATANGTLSVSGTSATMAEQVTFTNQNGICKFQFQDKGNGNAAITGITKLVIKDNTDAEITTATLPAAADYVWVAMAPITTTSKVNFEVTTADKTYTGSANAIVEASKKYILTLKVTASLTAVDLGLSVNWANMNVGATSETEYGDCFAWGEVTPKPDYSWSTYEWGTGFNALTKYNNDSSYGTVDNKTVLDPEDDAAHVNMGGTWRMPTAAEFQELMINTTHAWVTDYKGSGVNGFTFTGNGHTIFLPAAGYRYDTDLFGQGSTGYYWSSSLAVNGPYNGWYLDFHNNGLVYVSSSNYRCWGMSVRGVQGK
ncbi:MAG: hypothetical protein IKI16_06860 [Prevotella sp.]|nr:hypothetical protein [Prevotella sp.]